jgi:hypothetical protein
MSNKTTVVSISTGCFVPEHMNITFETNGKQGGNHSHGGWARLTLKQDCGYAKGYIIKSDAVPQDYVDLTDHAISIMVRGDWEIDGLITSLVNLGKILEKRFPDSVIDPEDWE